MKKMNYEAAGVNIDMANETKNKFKDIVSAQDLAHCKPINKVGAFSSLVEIDLSKYENPVFVLKSEEPGSKQLLSIENNREEWIARDLINHLVDDIIVMGATPCAVLDTIICGKFEKEVILKLVDEISKACIENGCILVGGETSEQPGTLPAGRYVLQASVLGVVDKSKIIDGNKIEPGDVLIALPSNGLHTNGYSLVRKLMETMPDILSESVDGESFTDSILKPHSSYSKLVGVLLEKYFDDIHGMAHITGGGIHDNLIRILQKDDVLASIDLSTIKIPTVFKTIQRYANISDEEMLTTFNMGVGIIMVVSKQNADAVINTLNENGTSAYLMGKIEKTSEMKEVVFSGELNWGC